MSHAHNHNIEDSRMKKKENLKVHVVFQEILNIRKQKKKTIAYPIYIYHLDQPVVEVVYHNLQLYHSEGKYISSEAGGQVGGGMLIILAVQCLSPGLVTAMC
jgi:hypothetical protein